MDVHQMIAVREVPVKNPGVSQNRHDMRKYFKNGVKIGREHNAIIVDMKKKFVEKDVDQFMVRWFEEHSTADTDMFWRVRKDNHMIGILEGYMYNIQQT